MTSLSHLLVVDSAVFLVQWLGHPQFDVTCITEDEFCDLNPTLQEWYLQDNSLKSSSFPMGENDASSPKRFYDNIYSRKHRKFRNLRILSLG